MLDFDWESSEVGGEVVNAVREVVAPGSGKFPLQPTHQPTQQPTPVKPATCSPPATIAAALLPGKYVAELCQAFLGGVSRREGSDLVP